MDIKNLISQMTLEEKASLCSGEDFWHTQEIKRLNIPKMMLSDGPHGLRKQDLEGDHLGINKSIQAVCFPTGATIAASFDRDLIHTVGEALGQECQAEHVGVILGPAVNIKRSPLCGRNFEYLSEDPYLSSEMAASQIEGIQSKNVGASIKHFLANNQEHRRMTSSSEIDERTLREIYLASFEKPVKEAKPWTVMCSYNKINGTYASENYHYLTKILRDEWGFDGVVVSDWGAVNDRVMGIKAGMDLEMPSSHGYNDSRIVQAVQEGILEEAVLDQCVENILKMVERFNKSRDVEAVFDRDSHHDLARKAASESMVLLKNENILPLSRKAKIGFIGQFATNPRFQGGGSSHINTHKTTSALDSVDIEVSYAKGYHIHEDSIDQQLVDEAIKVAKEVEVAVIFAGLPDEFESEGYDRQHMNLPESHNYLIQSVLKEQPNTVVVLHNGSPVEMPWINEVKGVLEVYLSGQSVGEATVDILFGDVNPSGKLPETFPISLADNPSYLYYFGEKDVVEYREGIFVGYRYYDKKEMPVLFPFGHGLSYTSFTYSNMTLSHTKINEDDTLTVTVDVENSGDCYGKEVVQLYVSDTVSSVIRPIKELKGFEKIGLHPKEKKQVVLNLDKRSFAYYNSQLKDWHVESGDFELLIGKSSRDIQCRERVYVQSNTVIKEKYTINSMIGDLLKIESKKVLIQPFIEIMAKTFRVNKESTDPSNVTITEETMDAMFNDMPLRSLVSNGGGTIDFRMLDDLIDQLNS